MDKRKPLSAGPGDTSARAFCGAGPEVRTPDYCDSCRLTVCIISGPIARLVIFPDLVQECSFQTTLWGKLSLTRERSSRRNIQATSSIFPVLTVEFCAYIFWALVGTDVAEMLEFSTDIIVPQGHRLSMTLLSTVQADHGVLISSIRDPNWFLDIWLQKGSQGGCERDSGVQIDRRTPQTAGFSFSG